MHGQFKEEILYMSESGVKTDDRKTFVNLELHETMGPGKELEIIYGKI